MTESVEDLHGARAVATKSGPCLRCGKRIRLLRTEKKCPVCKRVRPWSDFSHTKRRPDHLDSICRQDINAKGRAEAFGEAMPLNPVAAGVVTGELMSVFGDSNGRGGGYYVTLVLQRAEIFDRYDDTRSTAESVNVYVTGEFRFDWQQGDRVIVVLSDGIVSRVVHRERGGSTSAVPTDADRAAEVAYDNGFADLRQSLLTLLPRWFPRWTPPADTPTWTEEVVKVVNCPFGQHDDRPAFLTWEVIKCSRHTDSQWLGARDIMTKRLGYSEEEALKELARIEDDELEKETSR